MKDASKETYVSSGRLRQVILLATLTVTWTYSGHMPYAQVNSGPTRAPQDPAQSGFGTTDPVNSSLKATEQLGPRFQEQQHRLQPDSNHRQLRARRPEPGESEVTREEGSIPLHDPLRNTLRSILPRDR